MCGLGFWLQMEWVMETVKCCVYLCTIIYRPYLNRLISCLAYWLSLKPIAIRLPIGAKWADVIEHSVWAWALLLFLFSSSVGYYFAGYSIRKFENQYAINASHERRSSLQVILFVSVDRRNVLDNKQWWDLLIEPMIGVHLFACLF